jgi:cell division protein FtsB
MRIRHSFSYSMRLLAIPVATLSIGAYFGAYAIWGARGVKALETTQAELGVDQQQLVQLKERGAKLRHRIELIDQPNADLDLVEELARTKLMTAAPHQAAIARDGN